MLQKKIIGLFAVYALISSIFTGCGIPTSGSVSSASKNKTKATDEISQAEESSFDESSKEILSKSSNDDEHKIANKVLYESDLVRITYNGLKNDDWYGDVLDITIENRSDKNITVQTENTSVNGVMADPYFYCDVSAGKKATDFINFDIDEEIGTVEFSFHIYDSDSYDTLEDSDMLTLTVNENVSVKKQEGTKVCEVGDIVISYIGVEKDDIWGTEIQFLIENNGSETYSVHTDDVSIDGVMHNGSLYAEISAGKCAKEAMSFIGDDSIPDEMKQLKFTVQVVNSNYETVAESDMIQVALD